MTTAAAYKPMEFDMEQLGALYRTFKVLGGPLQVFQAPHYGVASAVVDNAVKLNRTCWNAKLSGEDLYVTWNLMANDSRAKGSAVAEYRAFFIDFDCGRDADNKFFSMEKVDAFVAEKMQVLHDFAYQPNVILRTRNGLHAVWFIDPEQRPYFNEELFVACQKTLIRYFGSDDSVKTGNHLMRCPLSYWVKAKENLPTFLTQLSFLHSDCFDVNVLMEAVGYYDAEAEEENVSTNIVTSDTAVGSTTEAVDAIKAFDVPYFKARYSAPKMLFMTRATAVAYIKSSVDLGDFLGLPVGSSFRCIFHNDRKPSAGILPPKKGAPNWLYCCSSSNCGVKGNIVDVVMRLAGVNSHKAINFLFDALSIKFGGHKTYDVVPGDVSVKDAGKRIQRFFNAFNSRPEMKKALSPLADALKMVIKIANEADQRTGVGFLGESFTFPVSKRYLASRLGESNDGGKVFKKLTLLTAMGFLVRVADEDMPEGAKRSASSWLDEQFSKHEKTVQFYQLPVIDDMLDVIEANIDSWINAHMAINKINYSVIVRVYGEEVAVSVYPKTADLFDYQQMA